MAPKSIGIKLQTSPQKTQNRAQRLYNWRCRQFNYALLQIEKTFLDIQQTGKITWQQGKAATKAMLRINIYNTDLYFLVGGMAILVFVTRSFTEPGVEYGPWRPVVIGLAALLAGIIPLALSIILFQMHLFMKVSTWALTGLNVVLSANIFSFIEPTIPNYFYTEGILGYQELIMGMLVFYALALGYLQLRLNTHYCFICFLKRHKAQGLDGLLPADRRGAVIMLSAQDHYVEIKTVNGQHLSRISMKDAVAMVPEGSGMQVHRSHWVAFSAILKMEKAGGKPYILLRNGIKVPVSKTKINEVQAYVDSR